MPFDSVDQEFLDRRKKVVESSTLDFLNRKIEEERKAAEPVPTQPQLPQERTSASGPTNPLSATKTPSKPKMDPFAATSAKVLGSAVKGATMGAIDPIEGTIGVPFTDIKHRFSPTLVETLTSLGVDPKVAEATLPDIVGETIGSFMPFQKLVGLYGTIARGLTTGKQLAPIGIRTGTTFLAKALDSSIKAASVGGAMATLDAAQTGGMDPSDRLKSAGINFAIGATFDVGLRHVAAPILQSTINGIGRATGYAARAQLFLRGVKTLADEFYGNGFAKNTGEAYEKAWRVASEAVQAKGGLSKIRLNSLKDWQKQNRDISALHKRAKGKPGEPIDVTPEPTPGNTNVTTPPEPNFVKEGLNARPPETLNPAQIETVVRVRRPRPLPFGFQSVAQATETLQNENYAILTATNPQKTPTVDYEGRDPNEVLIQDLLSRGYEDIIPVKGREENDYVESFIVRGMSPDETLELLERHGQRAAMVKGGILYDDKTFQASKGLTFGKEAEESIYNTAILNPDGPPITFSVDLDERRIPHPEIGVGASGYPEETPEGDLVLERYLKRGDITEVDPLDASSRTNIGAAEMRRLQNYVSETQGGVFIPRVNAYVAGTEGEPNVVSLPFKATMRVPARSIYDFSKDPEGFIAAAEDMDPSPAGRMTYAEKMIRDAGYLGYRVPTHPQMPNAVVLFSKTPVEKVEPTGEILGPVQLEDFEAGAVGGKFDDSAGHGAELAQRMHDRLQLEEISERIEGIKQKISETTGLPPEEVEKIAGEINAHFSEQIKVLNNLSSAELPSVADRLDVLAQEAQQRISQRVQGKMMDVTEAAVQGVGSIRDYSIIGAALLGKGVKNLKKEILSRFRGDPEVKKNIDKIVKKSASLYENQLEATNQQFGKMIGTLVDIVKQSEINPQWYKHAYPVAEKFFGNEADAVRFWVINAGLSPQNEVGANMRQGWEVFRAYKMGEAAGHSGIETARDTIHRMAMIPSHAQRDSTIDALLAIDDNPTRENVVALAKAQKLFGKKSPKVHDYIQALMGREDVVVVDSHMADAFGMKGIAKSGQSAGQEVPLGLTDPRRDIIKAWVTLEGKELGITPVEAQAAIWTAEKIYKAISGAVAQGSSVQEAVTAGVSVRGTIDTIDKVFEDFARSIKDQLDREIPGLDWSSLEPKLTSEFKKWFEGSKVVDQKGSPLTVYHGTRGDFKDFAPTKGSNSTIFGSYDVERSGFFFSESPSVASGFAMQGDGEGANVRPVHLAIFKPLDLTTGDISDALLNTLEANGLTGRHARYLLKFRADDFWEAFDNENGGRELVEALKKSGYDGVKLLEPGIDGEAATISWVAFDSEQIRPSFESGFAHLGFVTLLARALVGAAIGGTEGETAEERIQNALIYGAGAAVAPQVIRAGAKGIAKALSSFGQNKRVADIMKSSGLEDDVMRVFDPVGMRKPAIPSPGVKPKATPQKAGMPTAAPTPGEAPGAPVQGSNGAAAEGAPVVEGVDIGSIMPPPPNPTVNPTAVPKGTHEMLTEEQVQKLVDLDPSIINLGTKALKIHWDEIGSQDDIENILKKITSVNAENIDKARRGTMSMQKTKELARKMGVDFDQIVARREGQALNAEEAQAYIDFLGASLKETSRVMDELVTNPGNAELEERFVHSLNIVKAVHESVMGARAEAGRALNVWKTTAQGYLDLSNQLVTSMNTLTPENAQFVESFKRVTPTRLAIALKATIPNAKELSKFVDKVTRPGAGDMFFEVMYGAMLLSNPATLAINAISNAITMGFSVPERFLAAGIGTTLRGLESVGVAPHQVDHVGAREAAAYTYGLMNSVSHAFDIAGHAFKTGERTTGGKKIEMSNEDAITAENLGLTGPIGYVADYLGAAIRTPLRGLMSTDEFFKMTQSYAQLYANAYRQAEAQGLDGDDFAKSVIERFREMPPEDVDSAKAFGDYQTFTQRLGPAGQHISQAINSLPLKYRIPIKMFLIPFHTVPTNLFKFAAERIPGPAFLHHTFQQEIKAGGARRDLALAKLMTGTALVLGGAMLYLQGKINGKESLDPGERFIERSGRQQEYSVQAEDGTQIGFDRLDPYGMILGFGADWAKIVYGNPDSDLAQRLLLAAVLPVAWNLTSKHYLEGSARLMKAVSAQKLDELAQYFKRSSSIVVPGFIRQLNKTGVLNQKYVRESRDAWDAIIAQTPGYSDTIPPQTDIFGHPVVIPGGLGPDIISGIAVSKRRNEPHYRELIDSKIAAMPVGDWIEGNEVSELTLEEPDPNDGVELTPQEHHRYRVLVGHEAKINGKTFEDSIKELVDSKRWKTGNDFIRQVLFNSVYGQYKKVGRAQLLKENENLRERVKIRLLEKRNQIRAKREGAR